MCHRHHRCRAPCNDSTAAPRTAGQASVGTILGITSIALKTQERRTDKAEGELKDWALGVLSQRIVDPNQSPPSPPQDPPEAVHDKPLLFIGKHVQSPLPMAPNLQRSCGEGSDRAGRVPQAARPPCHWGCVAAPRRNAPRNKRGT